MRAIRPRSRATLFRAALAGLVAVLAAGLGFPASPPTPDAGTLEIVGPRPGETSACPLRHTSVEAAISGFVARTTVRQVFHNPLDRKIEAIYVFPLPEDAAVDDMVLTVGERRVVGTIRERGEAREIYERARAAGHVAGLLDQERPNIFTQSVANIEPGVEVAIEIRYVETLTYDEGVFEWVFPMVVGPRYIPGGGSAAAPMSHGRPTDQVPDASRITPPVVPQGTRSGHDVSVTVELEAGTEIHELTSVLHEVDVTRRRRSAARVQLRERQTIPNRDFVLRYRVASDHIENAFFTHSDARGDFFTLILQPPRRVEPRLRVARELIFVLDSSGSMSGFPMDKAKQLMGRMIDTMESADTFNLITFAGNTRILWDRPRPNTRSNRDEAQRFLGEQRGGGGTEMMRAIHAALDQQDSGDVDRMRIVCFLTDGYVGNDMAIIDAVRRNADTTRVFSFGIGNSVNRYLLDGMAHAGRGEVEYVTLASDGDAAVERFQQRVLAPVLTDIELLWEGLRVSEVYPRRIPDLFAAKPILVHGRLSGPAAGTLRIRGRNGAGTYEDTLDLRTLRRRAQGDALPSLWARAKVEELMNADLESLQRGRFPEELRQQITELGLDFRLMTQFTSFVAVEELYVTVGGEPTRVEVPVEMPDGVSYEGVFGREKTQMLTANAPAAAFSQKVARMAPPPAGVDRSRLVEADAVLEEQELRKPADKLAAPLRGLAERVLRSGSHGRLTLDGIEVVDFEVQVLVTLADLEPSTLERLRRVGFVPSAESSVTRLLVGRIDVRRLEALAELDAVVSIRPVRR